MTKEVSQIETETALISFVATSLIEQRFKPDAPMTAAVYEQNRKARKKLTKGRPVALMIVIPAETPVNPPSTNHDHFRKESEERSILALAVVANSAVMSAVTKFYFRYYPQSFEVRVFDEEDDAKNWLLLSLKSY